MDELREANEAFYRAFVDLDLQALDAVWRGSERDHCVHPGWEPLQGWEAIRASFAAIFASTGYMRFHVSDVRAELGPELGAVHCVENIYSVGAGATMTNRVAALNLFRRVDGHWKLVAHFGSPILAAGSEPQLVDPAEN